MAAMKATVRPEASVSKCMDAPSCRCWRKALNWRCKGRGEGSQRAGVGWLAAMLLLLVLTLAMPQNMLVHTTVRATAKREALAPAGA